MSILATLSTELYSIGFYAGAKPSQAPDISYPILISSTDTELRIDGSEVSNMSFSIEPIPIILDNIRALLNTDCSIIDIRTGDELISGKVVRIHIESSIRIEVSI